MGPIAESVAELIRAADRAVMEVRRECGMPEDGPEEAFDVTDYIEKLEAKVREQAMALRIAGVTVMRQDGLPIYTRPV